MAILTLEFVRSLLSERRFQDLVGGFENEWLECKRQPYDLSKDEQKLELAKDVCSLANACGGMLLLGYATTRDEVFGDDKIESVRPVPVERFQKSQYENVLKEWLYPPIEGLRTTTYDVPGQSGYVIVSIDVPKVTGPDSPVLVAKTLLDSGYKAQTLVGYFVRKQSHVAHFDVKRIQATFRDGLRYDAEVREHFAQVHAAIASLHTTVNAAGSMRTEGSASSVDRLPLPPADEGVSLNAEPPRVKFRTIDEVKNAISEALKAVELDGHPAMVLSAIPIRELDLTGLFDSNNADLVRRLESPSAVRDHGFNLGTGERSRIVSGKMRRAVEVGYKLLEVHRNGVVVFAIDGGPNGLCWGRPQKQTNYYLINQIALIEYVYLFCRFVHEVHASSAKEDFKLRLQFNLFDMAFNENPPRLEPGLPETLRSPKAADEARVEVSCDVDAGIGPDRAAFQLLSEIYWKFGFETDNMPLMSVSPNGDLRFDVDALTSLT
jgi:hypothetical protein